MNQGNQKYDKYFITYDSDLVTPNKIWGQLGGLFTTVSMHFYEDNNWKSLYNANDVDRTWHEFIPDLDQYTFEVSEAEIFEILL
tara:strand:+ start:843 stop:1094 length:252 start_codon:yes stop_codon:yes gene_type:complete